MSSIVCDGSVVVTGALIILLSLSLNIVLLNVYRKGKRDAEQMRVQHEASYKARRLENGVHRMLLSSDQYVKPRWDAVMKHMSDATYLREHMGGRPYLRKLKNGVWVCTMRPLNNREGSHPVRGMAYSPKVACIAWLAQMELWLNMEPRYDPD